MTCSLLSACMMPAVRGNDSVWKEDVDTCPEVDHNVYEEDGVGNTVEDNPSGGEVVVKKRDCDWKNDQVCHKQQKHAEIPVKSGNDQIKR